MKHTHWYLRGWEYEDRVGPDGKSKRQLVYKGEYYRAGLGGHPPAGFKVGCAVFAALLWAGLLVMLSHISRGASLFFVGGPCGLALIPAIYLAIGCIRAVGVPPIMTYRDMRASFQRIKTSAKWILGLMAVSLAGELFYLAFRAVGGYAIDWAAEGLWAGGSALGVLFAAAELTLLRCYRVEVCPPGVDPNHNK